LLFLTKIVREIHGMVTEYFLL